MGSFTERYRPRTVAEFAGLKPVKRYMERLIRQPEAQSLLLVGPPGVGKTTMALALADELNAGLLHIRAQKCNAETVESVWEQVHYYPPDGKQWWVVLCDEADQMSRAAQLALLSHLDSTANLAFDFGGSVRETKPLPVIWIFTANGTGLNECNAPATLEARFLSRMSAVIPFRADSIKAEMAQFLRSIWEREGGEGQPQNPDEVIRKIIFASKGCVRDALNKLELALLDCDFDDEPEPETVASEPEPEMAPEPAPVFALSAEAEAPMTLWERQQAEERAFWTRQEEARKHTQVLFAK